MSLTKEAARVFKGFRYQTLHSWTCECRMVGKAEYQNKGANPRFVVTSIKQMDARALYEQLYCGRGDMENRIKEQQLWLFADRTSAGKKRANQLRLYFSSVAYMLIHALRRLGLKGTQMAKAQCNSIRFKLLKIGAQIRITVRKVWVSLAGGYPYMELFHQVYRNLRAQSFASDEPERLAVSVARYESDTEAESFIRLFGKPGSYRKINP